MAAAMTASWLLGVLVGAWAPGAGEPWRPVVALAALALGGLAVRLGRVDASPRPGARTRVACGLVALASLAAGIAAGRAAPEPPLPPEGIARLDGRVHRVDHGRHGASSILRVERGTRLRDGEPVAPGTRLRVRGVLPWGARVRILARVRPTPRFRNPSPHPPWPSFSPVSGVARPVPGSGFRTLAAAPAWRRALEHVRRSARRALSASLPDRTAGLARALVLGDRAAVSPEDRDAVRDAGLAHVLAVSGLHVALVAGLAVAGLGWVLRRVEPLAQRVEPRRLTAAAGIPLACGYAALAGGAPSAWRAAAMASLGWTLIAAGRSPRAIPVAALAVLGLGAIEPEAVVRPGFLLSVLAVAGLVTARLDPDVGPLRAAATVSARAMVATAPLVVWCFGSVPAVGLVANVVLVPLGSLLLVPLAILHALASAASLPVAPLTGGAFDGVARAFVAACDTFAAIPLGRNLPPPSVPQALVLAVGCGGILAARRLPVRLGIVALAAAAIGAGELHLRHAERPRGELRVTFLDVGQGDAALVDLPDGRLMLVDAGGKVFGGPDPGERALLPLLRARRRSHIDVVLVSHPHPDHYAGLGALRGRVTVGEVWSSGQARAEEPNGPAARMLGRFTAAGVPIREPPSLCTGRRAFGAARVEVLWPCPAFDAGYDANDNSLLARLRYGERSVLLTGDIEAAGEAEVLRRRIHLAADVLKVAHHGSRTSTTDAFLRQVSPDLAVVSCGRANRFGHPHLDVLARLEQHGARVLRTDRSGGVVLRTRGRRWQAHTWAGERWTGP